MAWWDRIGAGRMVTRATRVIANETYTIFNVLGGRVLLTNLIGTITIICAATANVFVQLDPTAGTATTTALCAATDVDTYNVDEVVGITGIPTDTLIPAARSSAIPSMTMPVILTVGALQYESDAASGGGAIQWEVWYKPLDDAGYIVAA